MGRQRTINDQLFWRSPKLQKSTIEDKVVNLHLLTSPDSNIIGAYCLVAQIAAAEISLPQEKWLQIMVNVESQDLASYDRDLMFVWVRNWWDHHSARQTMGPKLRDRTIEEIKKLPQLFRDKFLYDFRQRISKEHQTLLDEALISDEIEDQTQYGYDIDTASKLPRLNNNVNTKSNLKKTSTTESASVTEVDNSGIPQNYRDDVNQALNKAMQNGLARVEPQHVIDTLARQFKSSNPPRVPAAMAYFLAQHLRINESKSSVGNLQDEELAALKGRCFAWPSDNPENYARVEDYGQFELFFWENGQFLRRIGLLKNSDLVKAIRANHVVEISSSYLDNIIKGELT